MVSSFDGIVGSMERPVSDDMLAGIPSQLLDQKTSDIHLAYISKSLVRWKQARSYLGLTEAGEEIIWRDNPTLGEQRSVLHVLKRVVNRELIRWNRI